MPDSFYIYESPDFGLNWVLRVGTSSYNNAYALARDYSQQVPDRIFRIKNVRIDEWLAAFRAGDIFNMLPPKADDWKRGLTDAGREL